MRSRNESSANTTIFVDNGVVISGEAARTTTKPFSVVKVNLAEAEVLPHGYVRIEDLVAEVEADKEDKAGLTEARRWVGKTFYKGSKSLRAMRLKRGLSQAKLAEAMGTTQSHIARVENGEVDVQVSTLMRIATVFGAPHTKVYEAYVNTRRAVAALPE